MRIFVSAGESSSDIHCAQLIKHLKIKAPIEIFGIGGDELSKQGAILWHHIRELSVGGGPLEVISKWPLRRQILRRLEQEIIASKIDGAILVDNGEINLKLAALLRFFEIPVVYYIPPKVWVWRASRLETISQHVSLVLGILPFEKSIYESWQIPFEYVGSPLVDELDFAMTIEQARRNLGLAEDGRYLAILPGSRFTEIQYHVGIFAEALNLLAKKIQTNGGQIPEFLVPVAAAIDLDEVSREFRRKLDPSLKIHLFKGRSHEVLKSADVALVKSGTSTLEAALLDVPMVLAYATSQSAKVIFRHIVRYRGFVGMVNLFLAKNTAEALGWNKSSTPVVNELILDLCRPELIAEELYELIVDSSKKARMKEEYLRLKTLVRPDSNASLSPSARAAELAFSVFTKGEKK